VRICFIEAVSVIGTDIEKNNPVRVFICVSATIHHLHINLIVAGLIYPGGNHFGLVDANYTLRLSLNLKTSKNCSNHLKSGKPEYQCLNIILQQTSHCRHSFRLNNVVSNDKNRHNPICIENILNSGFPLDR
jgi:hypothetical protein